MILKGFKVIGLDSVHLDTMELPPAGKGGWSPVIYGIKEHRFTWIYGKLGLARRQGKRLVKLYDLGVTCFVSDPKSFHVSKSRRFYFVCVPKPVRKGVQYPLLALDLEAEKFAVFPCANGMQYGLKELGPRKFQMKLLETPGKAFPSRDGEVWNLNDAEWCPLSKVAMI